MCPRSRACRSSSWLAEDPSSQPFACPSNSSLPLRHRLADLVDLRATVGARAHRRRLAILHRDWLRVLHFDLSLVLQTVAFHYSPSSVEIRFGGGTRPF